MAIKFNLEFIINFLSKIGIKNFTFFRIKFYDPPIKMTSKYKFIINKIHLAINIYESKIKCKNVIR